MPVTSILVFLEEGLGEFPLDKLRLNRKITMKGGYLETVSEQFKQVKQLMPNQRRLAKMLKALGNPIRFQIMQTLSERQMCMTHEIVATTPLAQSTVSQHLKVLREAGLIQGEIEGPATCYCINADGVRWLKEQIEGWLPDCCPPGYADTRSNGCESCS